MSSARQTKKYLQEFARYTNEKLQNRMVYELSHKYDVELVETKNNILFLKEKLLDYALDLKNFHKFSEDIPT